MRDRTKYSELENKVIDSIRQQLKDELKDNPFASKEVEVTIGKDRNGELTIQAIWNHFDYSDDDRFGGFRDDTYIIGRHCFSEAEMKIPGLLEETIKDFVGVVGKIPENSVNAGSHLKFEAFYKRYSESRVESTAGIDPTSYKLKEAEKICENGKYFEEEKPAENKNELNNDHIEPNYDEYRNKRDDDDGGDDGDGAPAAELTPSYDDDEGLGL